jgi:UDP-N-acetylglucosamine 2-epimerase (non-hydrolysing)
MRRALVCLGTRPEVVKLAPVIAALEASPSFEVTVATTAQHRQMLDQMLRTFGIEPQFDLGLMRERQTLADLTGAAVPALASVIEIVRPDVVIVQGDTTTTFCAALAAFYEGVPVAHVEAGLRTHDLASPFPEELNRKLTGSIARWHFCATPAAAANLLGEGVAPKTIEVTGNTVIDALLTTRARVLEHGWRARTAIPPKRDGLKRVLVTLHRRESQGMPQRRLCQMLARLAAEQPIDVVFPVHLSPSVRTVVLDELAAASNVHLIDPLEYEDFVYALAHSDIVLTDSGGVQEEAPSLDVPVLVLREVTERPEGIDAGCARLSGTDPAVVAQHLGEVLGDSAVYDRMSAAANPYGDGTAAARIVSRLELDLPLTAPTLTLV